MKNMRKKILGFMLVLSLAVTAFATVSFAEDNSLLKNGSFENFKGEVDKFPTDVEGWTTTDPQGRFEISGTPGTYGLTSAADGTYFLELNSYQSDTISQTIATKPGMTLKWSLKHANRAEDTAEVQTVEVRIGSGENYLAYPSETATVYKGETAVTTIGGENSVSNDWTEYTGYYTVPEGQTETTFSIASLITNGGWGNMLDDIKVIDVTEYAASIDDVKYMTLADAVTAAEAGETITLLKNVDEEVIISLGKTLTIDLNGKTLSCSTANYAINNSGNLTISDSSGNNSGTVTSIHGIANKAALTITGGTITNTVASQPAIWQLDNATGMTITGGVIAGKNVAIYDQVSTSVNYIGKDVVLSSTPSYTWAYVLSTYGPTGGKWTIESGVTLKSIPYVSGETTTADNWINTSVLTVENGANLILEEQTAEGSYEVVKVAYNVAQIGDKYYKTLKEAIDAAGVGETVTLLADVEISSISTSTLYGIEFDSSDNFTIDLGGHTINYTGSGVALLNNDGAVTIQNGNIVTTSSAKYVAYTNAAGTTNLKNVNITHNGTSYAVATIGSINLDNCTVTATVDGASAFAVMSGGVITANGGEYDGELSVLDTDKNSQIIINGGTFTADPTAYVPEGTKIITTADGKYVVNPKEENAEGDFKVTTDSGYYGEYENPTEGIIAFNAFYNGYDAEDITKFGLYIYVTESKKVSIEATTADALKENLGKFYATVSKIGTENFETPVFAIPYVVKGSIVSYGAAVSEAVNTEKWLGEKE